MIDKPADAQPERVLREALRKLMKESAAVLALAEPQLRKTIGNTNLAIFKRRVEEAGALLTSGLPDDDGGVAETARRHSAKCREQEAQRTREAEALLAGLPGEGAQPTDENIQTIANLAWSGFDSSKACKEIYAICRDSLDVTFRSQRRRNGS